MKHDKIVQQLIADAERDSNTLGFLLFGSVATGTQRDDSDIDVITILETSKPGSGINNTLVDGIKVGNLFITYDILVHSVGTVPYLLHPFENAKLLYDHGGVIQPLIDEVRNYFTAHPEIVAEWNIYYDQLKDEKAQFGYEKTTIIDVWNELEKRHSDGRTRRQFFNSFYMTNPFIFSILKKFL